MLRNLSVCLVSAALLVPTTAPAHADGFDRGHLVFDRYCGPGNIGGTPATQVGGLCQEHDEEWGRIGASLTRPPTRESYAADMRFSQGVQRVLSSGNATASEQVVGRVGQAAFALRNHRFIAEDAVRMLRSRRSR